MPSVGDIIEAAYVCFGLGQNAINVVHWRLQSITGVGATMNEIASKLSTDWAGFIKPLISTALTYRGAKVRVVSPVPTAVTLTTSGNGAGTVAGDPLPAQVAYVLSLRSSLAPPRTRGRIYLPATGESSNDATTTPTAGYVTNVNLLAVDLQVNKTVVGAGGNSVLMPVLFHRKPPQAFYQITASINRTSWGTQRRRSSINRGDVPAI